MRRRATVSRVLEIRAFVTCRHRRTVLHLVEGPCLPCRARGRWREGPILCICDNCDGRGITAEAARIFAEETDGLRLAEPCVRCANRSVSPDELTFGIIDILIPNGPRLAYDGFTRAAAAMSELRGDPALADRLFPPYNPTLFTLA